MKYEVKESEKNRSEIKRNYKESNRPMGVYQIKSIKENTIYLGSSKNLDGIKNRHIFELKINVHKINELQSVWNEVQENGIEFKVLEYIKPQDDLNYNYTEDLKLLEEIWFDKLIKEGNDCFCLQGTEVR